MPTKILVIHGPNLNLLGKRKRSVYGRATLAEINRAIERAARKEQVGVEFYQSNHEGELVEKLQESEGRYGAVVLNPAGFTHTSVALHDAVEAIRTPVVEVHLSNIQAREPFRHRSFISPVAEGVIYGFGMESYLLGLKGAIALARKRKTR